MKKVLTLIFLFTVQITMAQLPLETWKEKPTLISIDKKFEKESAIFILDLRRYEFVDDTSSDISCYKTFHKIIQLNDDKGIEIFNKIYLPGGENTSIIALRARTILPNGKVINFDSTTVKNTTDEEGNPQRIFALPGLEKGCQVEYQYTYKKEASFFGSDITQFRIPVLKSIVQVISPARLVFDIKNFNGTALIEKKYDDEFRVINCVSPELKPAEEEKYSNLTAQLYRVEYKLSYNYAKDSAARLFTWDQLAARLYENYSDVTDKEKKAVQDLINNLKLNKLTSTEDKLIALENSVKKTIMVNKEVESESASLVDQVLKTRIVETGIVKLYAIALEQLGIPFQYVVTGDRSNYTLLKDFENWNNADNMILYLTDQKKYLSPTRLEYRYPWIAPEWGNQLGIHCRVVVKDGIKTARADVRNIHSCTINLQCIDESRIRIYPAKDSVVVDSKQIFMGYTAAVYRSAFNFTSAEQQKTILKEMVKFGTNSETILSSKLENTDFDTYSKNKPFVINASASQTS